MSDIWSDIKHSVRMFANSPGFAFAALAALTLGIGVNTAIFTVVDAVLLKPLTYPDAGRIVMFMHTSPQGNNSSASLTDFHTYQQQTDVVQDVAAYDFGGPGYNLTGGRPDLVQGLHVTQRYFALFGAPVILGRTFTQQEDSPNGGHFVVISYGLWQRRFGGDPHIVGKALMLGNEPYTILGVVGQVLLYRPSR